MRRTVAWTAGCLGVVVVLVAALPAQSAPSEARQVEGLWKFTLSGAGGYVPVSGPVVLKLDHRPGGQLVVSDAALEQSTRTASLGDARALPVTIATPGGSERAEFVLGEIRPKSITGTATMGGTEVRFEAEWLLRAWACGNHRPRHVATSLEAMSQLEAQHGCTGWHSVR